MKIYISGAITGHDKHAVEVKFSQAATLIAEQGNTPLNPLDNGLPLGASWHDHMRADLKMMLDADQVWLLPCGHQSPGANIECELARWLNIPVVKIKK
ncbi:MAG: DUF4406 domain-containing protein [Mucinivorans sp.]